MEENPFSLDTPENEELYIDDPKKALKGYFEREGTLLVYVSNKNTFTTDIDVKNKCLS